MTAASMTDGELVMRVMFRVNLLLLKQHQLEDENEQLREENSRLRIALRGFDVEPVSPFPLLSGEEIIRILHPHGYGKR